LSKVSIIIPAFNEERFIKEVLAKVIHADTCGLEKEVLVINDCSTDNTMLRVQEFISEHSFGNVQVFSHEVNKGKGAAVQTGIEKATGEFLLIQDADFEYDPADYKDLLTPLVGGVADVVYGSRFIGSKPHRVLFFYHYTANRFLTFLSNLFTNLNLTDMETGYKAFRTALIKNISLKEKSFGFEPEITIKMARIKGIRIYEVGISYYGRTYEEGKKINWKDGVKAVFCIFKYGWGK
jgi:glycosyltransferase involved in cell wall biosynthesis